MRSVAIVLAVLALAGCSGDAPDDGAAPDTGTESEPAEARLGADPGARAAPRPRPRHASQVIPSRRLQPSTHHRPRRGAS